MCDREMIVAKTARWLATTPDALKHHPLIFHLQVEFDLSVTEAVAAIREAQLIRARAL